MFKNLKEAISWVESQVKFRPKTDLVRMQQAYQLLDLDLSHIKKIHVAGTNGKGSVVTYLASILKEAKYRVGTFTSPYLVFFNERIAINGEPIFDDALFALIQEMQSFNQKYQDSYSETLSFFEIITLMGFLYFAKEKVDYIIIEVGLGGTLDSTNILNYDLSLITNIGFDHMKQLGNTLESIASNKLGIVKPGNHLISTIDEKLHPFFKSHLEDLPATYQLLTLDDYQIISQDPLKFRYKQETYHLSMIGDHQVKNAILALEAAFRLLPNLDRSIIKKGLNNSIWPGRFQQIKPQVFVDGAHNIHAIEALKYSLEARYPDKKIHFLISALGDKDLQGMIDIIKPIAKRIVLTSFEDARFVSLAAYQEKDIPYIDDFKRAYQEITKQLGPDDILMITGSLHFVGYVLKNIER